MIKKRWEAMKKKNIVQGSTPKRKFPKLELITAFDYVLLKT